MQLPGHVFYGGATVTRAYDAAGAEYIGCCAHRLEGSNKVEFGFYVFKREGDGPWHPVPLQRFCTGRGSINSAGLWIAVNGSEFFTGSIPDFIPIDTSEARTTAHIAPDSPITALYTGTYKPTDLDTPEEMALRFTKLLKAVNQIVELLVEAGVVTR